MARGMWTGNISFGLVTIPVSVVSAENKTGSLDFELIDRNDHAHIGYQKINKKTGKVVDNEDIIKGLKLDSGKYATFEQDELSKLRIKGSRSIDIQQFIGRDEIDPMYFKKAYYLVPGKGGDKTYVLLRETLKKTEKYAVGLIVMHTRQQLVLIGAEDAAMTLQVIHYAAEVKTQKEIDLPAAGLKSTKVSDREIAMAEKLVEELTDKWNPKEFKDDYIQQVQAAVKRKGKTKIDDPEDEVEESASSMSKVLDLMPLLEKSLKKKSSKSSSKPAKRAKAS